MSHFWIPRGIWLLSCTVPTGLLHMPTTSGFWAIFLGKTELVNSPLKAVLGGGSQSPCLQLIISEVPDLRQRHVNSAIYIVKLLRTIPRHWMQDN